MQSLQCRLCREIVPLHTGIDGIQMGESIRLHLVSAHAETPQGQVQLMEHMKRVSWVMDLLAFDSPDSGTEYRNLLHQAVEQLLAPQLEVVPSC